MSLIQKLRGFGLAGLLLVALGLGHGSVAFATSTYGQGDYGTCTYGPCATHTVTQTPSGLKVAVNLTDGQIIPATGYTITITPLNGSGSSFKQADILIDGTRVATITPAPDGTASWQWNPQVNPGTHIQLLVTDTSGAVTPFTFTVSIAPVTQASGVSPGGSAPRSTPSTSKGSSVVGQLLSDATEGAKHTIKKLPAPVIYTFPYLLFALLLVEIVILLLQTKRELREAATVARLTAQEREIASMKQTLMELVSHYLRTPLTILQGGAEGLAHDGVPAATTTALQTVVRQLHDTIEGLVATTTQAGEVIGAEAAGATTPRRWALSAGRIAIWLPVVLVGLLVFCFVYLANEVSRFTTNTIGILTQVVVYSILILALYQVVRRWQLHRHDAVAAQKLLAEQQAVQAIRDGLITQTGDQLQAHVSSLGALVQSLPPTAANAKFVKRGYDQLHAVTNKFVIAGRLKGARSTEPYQVTSPQALYGQLEASLKQAIVDKPVTVNLPATDTPLPVQNPGLLSLVFATVLDNAVSYSQPQGIIEVAVNVAASDATLSITDHGSGISPEKQAALFQPFFKAEGAEAFNREGMGFSLYLDKLIMAYLGGTITLSSVPNQSTRVDVQWQLN